MGSGYDRSEEESSENEDFSVQSLKQRNKQRPHKIFSNLLATGNYGNL